MRVAEVEAAHGDLVMAFSDCRSIKKKSLRLAFACHALRHASEPLFPWPNAARGPIERSPKYGSGCPEMRSRDASNLEKMLLRPMRLDIKFASNPGGGGGIKSHEAADTSTLLLKDLISSPTSRA